MVMSPTCSFSFRKLFSVRGSAVLLEPDELPGLLVDLAVQRIEEMDRLEEIGDAVEGLVVDQDRAEQRLLHLDVMRDLAVKRLVFGGDDVGKAHFVPASCPACRRPGRLPPIRRIARKRGLDARYSTLIPAHESAADLISS